jgi:hypothetical protein
LPWFVPHREPVCSASYTLGFNNAIASLAFAALLAALCALHVRRREGATNGIGMILEEMFSYLGRTKFAIH